MLRDGAPSVRNKGYSRAPLIDKAAPFCCAHRKSDVLTIGSKLFLIVAADATGGHATSATRPGGRIDDPRNTKEWGVSWIRKAA